MVEMMKMKMKMIFKIPIAYLTQNMLIWQVIVN